MSLAVAKATTPPRYTVPTCRAHPRSVPSLAGRPGSAAAPPASSVLRIALSRDGLRPRLTPEPLRPPRQAKRAGHGLPLPQVPARQGLPSAPRLPARDGGGSDHHAPQATRRNAHQRTNRDNSQLAKSKGLTGPFHMSIPLSRKRTQVTAQLMESMGLPRSQIGQVIFSVRWHSLGSPERVVSPACACVGGDAGEADEVALACREVEDGEGRGGDCGVCHVPQCRKSVSQLRVLPGSCETSSGTRKRAREATAATVSQSADS